MSKSMSTVFERLGAPLRVVRQSWGAVRESDGTVFLRVWQDECNNVFDGVRYAKIHSAGRQGSFGNTERLEHIQRIRDGAICFLILCVARDVQGSPRIVQRCNSRELFCVGELLEKDGDVYIELPLRKVQI